MIDDIYIVLTVSLTTVLFIFGMMFRSLCGALESPVFRTVLRTMFFTYCFFGTVNLLELCCRTFLPVSDDALLLQIATLIIAVSQAFLFTYALILLIHATFVTRRRILRELVPIITLSLLLVIAGFTLPAGWVKIPVYLYTLFYIYLLIRYTRLFVFTYRECLRKLDNFFSGHEEERLKWVNFSFFAALSIGVLALTDSLFPAIHTGTVCTAIYMLFYLHFAFRLVNLSFVYNQLEKVLSDDDTQPHQPRQDEDRLPPTTPKPLEVNLKIWLDEKRFLQPGITIEDVALQIGTNRSYLSEHINSATGKTFRRWISELRIEEAKNLMRQNPGMTVNEIACAAGFVNNSHFARQFRHLTAVTPKTWRQNQH